MWIAGLIFLAIALGLAFAYSRSNARSAIFAATETSTVAQLEAIASELDTEMVYFAEMKGTVSTHFSQGK